MIQLISLGKRSISESAKRRAYESEDMPGRVVGTVGRGATHTSPLYGIAFLAWRDMGAMQAANKIDVTVIFHGISCRFFIVF